MGLIHTIALALNGCRVHLFDDDERRREAALAAGACFAGSPDLLSDRRHVDAWTDGWGFDALFCTRLGSRAVELSIQAAARGGRVILYQSILGGDSITLSANALHYREIRIIGSIAQSASDFRAAVGFLAQHAEKFSILHTEVFPAAAAAEAFRRSITGEVNRVMIAFQGES
jgi:L-iditol 2-dehydrogenase